MPLKCKSAWGWIVGSLKLSNNILGTFGLLLCVRAELFHRCEGLDRTLFSSLCFLFGVLGTVSRRLRLIGKPPSNACSYYGNDSH